MQRRRKLRDKGTKRPKNYWRGEFNLGTLESTGFLQEIWGLYLMVKDWNSLDSIPDSS